MRVLIVDDQLHARQSMKALLDVWTPPDEVREAVNGKEAVQLVELFHPDVILMDARMPGLDGLEATKMIKARWPRIRIVILTMYPEYELEALAAGADAFIRKVEPLEKIKQVLKEFRDEI